ncbi:MAG: DUF882 domain-containing protein [Gemmatimonadales bacterium]
MTIRSFLAPTGRLASGLLLLVGLVGRAAAEPVDTTRGLLSFLGKSGKLRIIPSQAAKVLRLPALERFFASRGSDLDPGFHDAEMAAPDGEAVHLLSLVPFSSKEHGLLGGYRLGVWPGERNGRQAVPDGFIPVTLDNLNLAVSKRFHLADFVTHDQPTVWPKYLVLEPRLLDKLELLADALEAAGRSAHLVVMSGFRTPQYNAKGVGRRGGRAKDSQHMYGDAADVFVDGDENGRMDDLNGDGRVNRADAQWLLALAEGIELAHPDLIGGLSAYKPTAAHGPFLHVDVRGVRARW